MLEADITLQLGGFSLRGRFTARAREVTALFGPSGAGKTSAVNAVAGLMRPRAGRITLNGTVLYDAGLGVNLPPERRRVGYVFQEGRLFPHLSVRGNLLYGHRLLPPAERRLGLERVAALLGLEPLLERRPARLSGGEKQRVAVGRALLTSPRLLLMDEPLASLDQARKDEVLPFLARLPRELDLPILYVSHSRGEIAALGARVVPVADGRILDPEAPPEPWAAPAESGG